MSFTKVYVGGLNLSTTNEDIKKFFRNCGNIREISLKDGYCFVEFANYMEAETACEEMDGRFLKGKYIEVKGCLKKN